MSKGSNRRPGTGYSAGYDGIDWGQRSEVASAPPAFPASLEMVKLYRSLVATMVHEFCPTMQGYLGPRIHGNFRCKINGQDSGLDSGFEVLTKIGMDYVLEAIEPPAKTCQNCLHWSEANQPIGFGTCCNSVIGAYHERAESRIWLTPPADFGCNRWEGKV